MIRALTHVFGSTRLRTAGLVACAVLAGACESNDPLDSVAPSDPGPTASDPSTSAVTPSFASVSYTGIPYGPFGLWATSTDVKWGPKPFTMSQNSEDAGGVVTHISSARLMGQRLVFMLAGGPSGNYTTNGKFDMTKWKKKMDSYNTTAIRNAIAAGVSDGTVVGNSLIDEPETKRWGGVITKSMLDQMASYAKKMFPTLPQGVAHGPPAYKWRPTEYYHVVDFVLYQYAWWVTKGDVNAWRTAVLARAKLDGVTPAFSINILDGGVEDLDGTWNCTSSGQAGVGTYYPMCRMTATQVRNWGLALVGYGCAMEMWTFNSTYVNKSDNLSALKDLGTAAASKPKRSCKRP
jgi:hypothetical protein